jgi:hypothetical protein
MRMSLKISVCGEDAGLEVEWVKSLHTALKGLLEFQICGSREQSEFGSIIFIGGTSDFIRSKLIETDRIGKAVFLIMQDQFEIPVLLKEGIVDDVMLFPFRSLEVLSKIRLYDQLRMWNQVSEINCSLQQILEQFKKDVDLIERLQKSKLPKRFPDLKGLRAESRYLAGMRSGGDFFDIAESEGKSHLSLVLTHSSSYGLSSAVLTVLMKVMMKLSVETMGKPGATEETVRKIYDELLLTLGVKDRLSLFYGTLSRENNTLRYLNFGATCAFFSLPSQRFVQLPVQGEPFVQGRTFMTGVEQEIQLVPDSRLVLLSNGFIELAGGIQGVQEILNQFRDHASVDTLNELAFRVKSKLTSKDDMPAVDCTALVIEPEAEILKLSK